MTRWVDPAAAEAEYLRAEAEERPCPYCRARTGDPCLNTWTGEPLHWQPAHWVRTVSDG